MKDEAALAVLHRWSHQTHNIDVASLKNRSDQHKDNQQFEFVCDSFEQ